MKITRKQIRKIIKEEAKRELPISYYSDEMLMQEGLLDFLGGLFGNLVDFFKGAWTEAEKNVKTQWGKAEDNLQGAISSVLGKGKGEEIKSFKDLDMEKKDHKKVYFAAVAPTATNLLKDALGNLKESENVKDWTPADDTEEAAKKWEEENGDSVTGLWKAFGLCNGMVRFFADQGMTEAEGIVGEFDSIADSGNPGQAVQHLVKCTNYVGNAFQFAVSAGIKEASGPIEVASQIVDSAKAIGSAIETSGKEQQKESLELRKLINGMIIAERKIIKENRRG